MHQDFLNYHLECGHADATLKFYVKELNPFFEFLANQGHSMQVEEVTAPDARSYMSHMIDRGLKPRTRRGRLQAIKSFLNWCVEWEYLEYNPTLKIKPPRGAPASKPFPPEGAFQALLAQCPPNRLLHARRAAMLWLFASTGIRRRELADLRTDDLHFGDDGFVDINGKGGKYRASALLNSPEAPVQQALEAYLEFRKDDIPWLWVTKWGKRLSWHGVGQDMGLLAEKAGLRDQIVDICHAWRRNCAVQAYEQGVDTAYILSNLGWSSHAMFDHYTRAKLQETQRARQAFRGFTPDRNRTELAGAPETPAIAAAKKQTREVKTMPQGEEADRWYELLGLSVGATERQVRNAFQQLSRACHPSLFPGDQDMAAKFRAVKEAYLALIGA